MLQAAAVSQMPIAAKVKALKSGEAGQGSRHGAQAGVAQAEAAQPCQHHQMLQVPQVASVPRRRRRHLKPQLRVAPEIKALEGGEAGQGWRQGAQAATFQAEAAQPRECRKLIQAAAGAQVVAVKVEVLQGGEDRLGRARGTALRPHLLRPSLRSPEKLLSALRILCRSVENGHAQSRHTMAMATLSALRTGEGGAGQRWVRVARGVLHYTACTARAERHQQHTFVAACPRYKCCQLFRHDVCLWIPGREARG